MFQLNCAIYTTSIKNNLPEKRMKNEMHVLFENMVFCKVAFIALYFMIRTIMSFVWHNRLEKEKQCNALAKDYQKG